MPSRPVWIGIIVGGVVLLIGLIVALTSTKASTSGTPTSRSASGGMGTGQAGPAGPAGPVGPVGLRGLIGPTGFGLDGVTGPTGPTGPAGPNGQNIRGPTGPDGPIIIGAPGPQGLSGDLAPPGPQGPTGPPGPPGGPFGVTGRMGSAGSTGPAGPRGEPGRDGLDGVVGPTGSEGMMGTRGATGPDGISVAGRPGVTGAPGPTGPGNPTVRSIDARYVSLKRIAPSVGKEAADVTYSTTQSGILMMTSGNAQTRKNNITTFTTEYAHGYSVGTLVRVVITTGDASFNVPNGQVLSVLNNWTFTLLNPGPDATVRVAANMLTNPSDRVPLQTIDLATFAVWAEVDGFMVRVPPVRVFATPRYQNNTVWDKGNALDENPETAYISSNSARPPVQYITLDLGTTRKVARVLLTPRQGYNFRMYGLQLQLGSGESSPAIVYARNLLTVQDAYEITFNVPSDDAVIPLMTSEYPEVFQIVRPGYDDRNDRYSLPNRDVARSVCAEYGADLATTAELTAAQRAGAQWCSQGWVSDNNPLYPMQDANGSCGNGPGIHSAYNAADPRFSRAGTNCYGVKPPGSTAKPGDTIFEWSRPVGGSVTTNVTSIPSYFDPRRST